MTSQWWWQRRGRKTKQWCGALTRGAGEGEEPPDDADYDGDDPGAPLGQALARLGLLGKGDDSLRHADLSVNAESDDHQEEDHRAELGLAQREIGRRETRVSVF